MVKAQTIHLGDKYVWLHTVCAHGKTSVQGEFDHVKIYEKIVFRVQLIRPWIIVSRDPQSHKLCRNRWLVKKVGCTSAKNKQNTRKNMFFGFLGNSTRFRTRGSGHHLRYTSNFAQILELIKNRWFPKFQTLGPNTDFHGGILKFSRFFNILTVLYSNSHKMNKKFFLNNAIYIFDVKFSAKSNSSVAKNLVF